MSWLESNQPWYVYYSGQRHGPLTPLETLRLAADGKLGPDDLVWTIGFPDWRAAQDVQGLYQPPPLPPGLTKRAASEPNGSDSKRSQASDEGTTGPRDGAGALSSDRAGAMSSDRASAPASDRAGGMSSDPASPPASDRSGAMSSDRASAPASDRAGGMSSDRAVGGPGDRTGAFGKDRTGADAGDTRPATDRLAAKVEFGRKDRNGAKTGDDLAEEPKEAAKSEPNGTDPPDESSDEAIEVREVLEALLSDQDEGQGQDRETSPNSKLEQDSESRRKGLIEQFVKRMRDQEGLASGSEPADSKSKARKGL